MSARAGIVVTGTEVLTGRVTDRNGPWIADRLLELGVGESVGEIVAEAVRVVRESGLANKTDSMFTVIEGDSWAEVMAVVERAVEAVAARATRVSVVIKADWRSGVTDAMTSKTESVERHLSAPPGDA